MTLGQPHGDSDIQQIGTGATASELLMKLIRFCHAAC